MDIQEKRYFSSNDELTDNVILSSVDEFYTTLESCSLESNFDGDTQEGTGKFSKQYNVENTDSILFEYNTYTTTGRFVITNEDTGEIIYDSTCIITNGLVSVGLDISDISRINIRIIPVCSRLSLTQWKYKLISTI